MWWSWRSRPTNQTGGVAVGTQQDPHTPSAAGEPDHAPTEEDEVGHQRPTRAGDTATVATDGSMSDEDFLRLQAKDGSRVDWCSMAADARRTEGMAQRDAIDEAGKEFQLPDDDKDGET